MFGEADVQRILSDYTEKLQKGVTEDDILEYWNVIVLLAETCLHRQADLRLAEEALTMVENIDPNLYDNVIRTTKKERSRAMWQEKLSIERRKHATKGSQEQGQ